MKKCVHCGKELPKYVVELNLEICPYCHQYVKHNHGDGKCILEIIQITK
jgi:hypothetical protein